jgi:trimethylamine---corrinoid protein Co-methyltransferase
MQKSSKQHFVPISTTPKRSLPLASTDLNTIHDATMEVLGSVGVRFASEAALNKFKDHGFQVKGQRVFFKERDVLNALETVPNQVTVLARNPIHNLPLTPETISFGTGRGAVTMVDPDGTHRAGTRQDYINVAKLAQSIDLIKHWGPLIHPGDIDVANAHLWIAKTMIEYLDKPYNYFSANDIDIIALSFGISRQDMIEQAGNGSSYGQGTVTAFSPLTLTGESCFDLFNYAECGVVFHVASMPIAGTTGPCTFPGLLVQQTCENLAPIVLSQLIRPGCPVFYGAIGSHADMRTMGTVFGSAEARAFEFAGAQVAKFYALLCRGNAGLTDAPISDFQAGAESMQHMLNVTRAGFNFLPGFGLMGNYMEASLAKIVLDVELAKYADRYYTPMNLSSEALALEVIEKVGPGGEFVTQPHTRIHCRSEFSTPKIFNRLPYDQWIAKGSKSATDLAHEEALNIIEHYEQPPMDSSIKKDLDLYVKKHWKN